VKRNNSRRLHLLNFANYIYALQGKWKATGSLELKREMKELPTWFFIGIA
jgi:hypothetical protein